MREILEKRIYGEIGFNSHKIPEIFSILELADFTHYQKEVGILFTAWRDQKDPTLELQRNKIKLSDFFEAQETVSTSVSVKKLCEELKEISTGEKVKKILKQEVPQTGVIQFVSEVQQQLAITTATGATEKTDTESIADEFHEYQLLYEEKAKNGSPLLGISSGFPKLDLVIDGLRRGHFWLLGGYTNLGKTFGALNIAAHLVKEGKRVVFYSLEMNRIDIFSRTLGILSEENGKAIAKGYVDQKKITPQIELLKNANFEIVTSKNELSQILLSMYEQTLRKPVDLFIIDYIGLVRVKNAKSSYEETTAVALELQNAAKRFNVPIIALSQVNNEAAKSGEQMVMGFKNSGDLGAAADLAIELVSGEESTTELRAKLNKSEPVKIKWLIKKNRHGPVGYVLMEFDGKTGISKEVDEDNY